MTFRVIEEQTNVTTKDTKIAKTPRHVNVLIFVTFVDFVVDRVCSTNAQANRSDRAGDRRRAIQTSPSRAVFVEADLQDPVDMVLSQLRQCSSAREFSVIAYCFMPDHLHLLVEGLSDESDLRNCIRVFKQQSSFVWRHAHEQPLWQRGYFDRVLRKEEDSVGVARYILNNPIRAGIVDAPEKYPFQGSLAMEFGDLIESIRRT